MFGLNGVFLCRLRCVLRLPFVATFLIAGVTVFGASKVGPSQPDRAAGVLKTLSAPENYGNLPLVFEPMPAKSTRQSGF